MGSPESGPEEVTVYFSTICKRVKIYVCVCVGRGVCVCASVSGHVFATGLSDHALSIFFRCLICVCRCFFFYAWM